ncbi:SCL-interrupting locus protein [Aplysia californica]|uniref:SCL-interrupting locus protein n=1 Tax=Aplysia californica TaxID=6500 RepID=A0ABM0JQK8_APLCA|nr:SCL-interrupting locus protein [Aplysia californica]
MESEFPKTTCSLWDKNSTGRSTFIHLSYYRKPKVCVPEKVLKLIQHQCENYGQTTYILVGSLVVEEDGEGVQFQVDRLDTRKQIPPDGAGLAPGDVLIPLDVTNNKAKERCGSVEDYSTALNRLQERCCSKSSIDLSSFMLLRGWGSFYSNAVTYVAHLDFDMVTVETVFKATPINPVPIVLTALSKNLAGPMSLSHMQGTPKTGFLTMDHTRKLLLVLESDPKTATLPIVGIWVSGTEYVQHPFVWAACLRYIHSTHLEDRVCMPPSEFLLVLYTPMHSRPEFFQCCSASGNSNFQFQLCTGHDVGNMTKSLSSRSDNFAEVELETVNSGAKIEMFDAARVKHGLLQSMQVRRESGGGGSVPDDIEPRAAPTPHMEKVPCFTPMVPDVSILWTEPSEVPQFPPASLPARPHLPFSSSSTPHLPYDNRSVTQHLQQMYTPVPSSSSYAQFQQSMTPAASVVSYGPPTTLNHGIVYHRKTEGPSPVQNIVSQRHQSSRSLQYQGHPGYVQQPGARQNGMFPNQQMPAVAHQPPVPSQSMTPLVASAPQFSATPSAQPYQGVGLGVHMAPHQGAYPTYTRPPSHPQPSFMSSAQRPGVPVQSAPLQAGPTMQPGVRIPGSQAVVQPSQSVQWNPQPGGILKTPSGQFQTGAMLQMPRTPVDAQGGGRNGHAVVQQSGHGQTSNGIFTPAPVQQQMSLPHQPVLAVSSLPSNLVPATGRSHGQYSGNTGIPVSMNKDSNPPMTFLKTVVEETSSSSSSSSNSKLSQGSVSGNRNLQASATTHNGSHSSGSSTSRISDDDSGLSITPDRMNPSPHGQALPMLSIASAPASSIGASASALCPTPSGLQASTASLETSMNSVKWDQVPPEIRMLLIQQNEQLKLLQQQISLLMHNQSQQLSASQSTARSHPDNITTSTQLSADASVGSQHNSKRCSVGINTSFMDSTGQTQQDGSTLRECRDVQTSPQKFTTVHPDFVASPVLMDPSSQPEEFSGPKSNGNTPAEIRNHGSVPVNSTRYEDVRSNNSENVVSNLEVHSARTPSSHTSSSGEEETDHRDLVSAAESIPVYDHTMNTVVSDLVVDMPDYSSTMDSKSQSQFDRSPTSVSDYYNNGQDDSYSTLAEDATDPKQYYSQLMNNIQMFLTGDGSQDAEASENVPLSDTTVQSSPCKASGNNDSTFVPQVNYISMLLGCSSDTGQSMEINAMAMKYLNDEQLTQMAKLRQGCPKNSQQSDYTEKILQRVIGHSKSSASAPDVSVLGISPNDMTMGTRKYMEKHGLLGGENDTFIGSKEPSFFDHTLRLKTDFSMAASACRDTDVSASGWQSSNDGDVDASSRLSLHSSPVKSPVCKEILRTRGNRPLGSPSTDGEGSPLANEKWLPDSLKASVQHKDLGASPVLPAPKHYNPNECNKENALKNGKGRVTKTKTCVKDFPVVNTDSVTTTSTEDQEEENLLDIEKLKQLPKLL